MEVLPPNNSPNMLVIKTGQWGRKAAGADPHKFRVLAVLLSWRRHATVTTTSLKPALPLQRYLKGIQKRVIDRLPMDKRHE
jgi:hypothetical protein